jgi:hypothetical protein
LCRLDGWQRRSRGFGYRFLFGQGHQFIKDWKTNAQQLGYGFALALIIEGAELRWA